MQDMKLYSCVEIPGGEECVDMIHSYNPATLEEAGSLPEVKPNELPGRIKMAKKSQKKWMSIPLKKRKKMLKRAQKILNEMKIEIARTISFETGKPRVESFNTDIIPAISAFDYSISKQKEIFKRKKLNLGGLNFLMRTLGKKSYIFPRPLGIIGIISPWNYPFGIPASETIMAVAAGNAVLLKPSSETPLTAMWIQEVFARADFPLGLVQVMPGKGSKIGQALIESEVDRVVFTGSVSVGKKVMRDASQNLTPVTLELGGKDPFVVFSDSNLERAINGAVWGSFLNSGQTCVGTKRIYVQREIYEEFLKQFKEKVEALKQGFDWNDSSISLGPLINEQALEDMKMYVKKALEQGAKLLTGGSPTPDMKGFFFQPTVFYDVSHNMDVANEEIFGPIVAVIPFENEEEAVKKANNSPFALSGSVWTEDLDKGVRIAKQLSSGTIDINNVAYTYGLVSTPWGGSKNSGFGRTHGKWGFEELMEPHHVHVDKGRFNREIWWQPYNEEKEKAGAELIEVGLLKKISKAFGFLRHFLSISRD